jgi:hypothetical protein
MVRATFSFYGRVTGLRKTFRMLLIDIDYFEGELCVSDNLEYSRGADEESELSSILFHTTLGRHRCQSQGPLKKPADYLDGRAIFRRHSDAHIGRDFY